MDRIKGLDIKGKKGRFLDLETPDKIQRFLGFVKRNHWRVQFFHLLLAVNICSDASHFDLQLYTGGRCDTATHYIDFDLQPTGARCGNNR